MHHQRQSRVANGLEAFKKLAIVIDADPRHMRIVAPGVFDHKNFERERPFFGESGNFFRHRAGRIVIEIDDGVLAVMLD